MYNIFIISLKKLVTNRKSSTAVEVYRFKKHGWQEGVRNIFVID